MDSGIFQRKCLLVLKKIWHKQSYEEVVIDLLNQIIL